MSKPRSAVTVDWLLSSCPDIQLTPEQLACCRYLERKGLRFCIDFGYENAPAMVWNELDCLAEAQQQWAGIC